MFFDTPGPRFSCQLPSLPAIVLLSPVTNYLLFSVIVSRPQGFLFPTEARERSCCFSPLSSWYCFPWGDPAAFPYLLSRHLPGKQSCWSKSHLKKAGQHPRAPVSQVCTLIISISPTNGPAVSCTVPWEEDFTSWIRRSAAKPVVRTLFCVTSAPHISCWPALGNSGCSMAAPRPSAETPGLTVSRETPSPDLDTELLFVGSQRRLRRSLESFLPR